MRYSSKFMWKEERQKARATKMKKDFRMAAMKGNNNMERRASDV